MKQTKKMGRGLEDFSHLFLSSPSEKPAGHDEKALDTTGEEKSLPVPVRTLCITSNKGIHERSFAVQLALSISRQGKNVVLFDADFCLPRLGMFLDASIRQNTLMHLIEAKGTETSALLDYKGMTLITVDADISTYPSLSPHERTVLENNFYAIEKNADIILVIISPEMTDLMRVFLNVISEIMVIVPQPVAEMINAYGFIKTIFSINSNARVGVLASRIAHLSQAEAVFAKMQQVVDKFLHKSLYSYGYIPEGTEFSLKQRESPLADLASADPVPPSVENIVKFLLENDAQQNHGIVQTPRASFTDRLFNKG